MNTPPDSAHVVRSSLILHGGDSPLISKVNAAEAGGGRAVSCEGGKAEATHILTRHQSTDIWKWGRANGKQLVNPLWLWDSYEEGEPLPLQDPVKYTLPLQFTVSSIMSCHHTFYHVYKAA